MHVARHSHNYQYTRSYWLTRGIAAKLKAIVDYTCADSDVELEKIADTRKSRDMTQNRAPRSPRGHMIRTT